MIFLQTLFPKFNVFILTLLTMSIIYLLFLYIDILNFIIEQFNSYNPNQY